MQFKNLVFMILICTLATPTFAATTNVDPKYCTMLKQLHTGMPISDVFLMMGPPHSFGQPPNLDMQAVNSSKPTVQPQSTVGANTPEARQRILQAMATDPILGAFINAPPDTTNALIWDFENNSISVAVKVKGPTVTDVKANFTCK